MRIAAAGAAPFVLASLVVLASSFVFASLAAAPVAAQDGGEGEELAEGVYARVIVDRTALRSGPGGSYQRVRSAERGDTFRVVSRASTGYWFKVELPDGTYAYVHGDTVYNHQVSRDEASGGRFAPDVFAPPALPHASGELAVQFGILGFFNGFMAIRPALAIAPEVELEANLAGSVGDGGRLFVVSGGPLINVFPSSPVVPFFTVGGGFAVAEANADGFLVDSGMVGVLYGGGGLRFGFRYRITIRIEARGYVFFDENRVTSLEEISAGATVFF